MPPERCEQWRQLALVTNVINTYLTLRVKRNVLFGQSIHIGEELHNHSFPPDMSYILIKFFSEFLLYKIN